MDALFQIVIGQKQGGTRELEKMQTVSTFRRHFLIFLQQANKKKVNPTEIRDRLIQTFDCKSIIIAQRNHPRGLNFDYIIGVKCTDASKNTVKQTIRALFFEFEGQLCHQSSIFFSSA